MRDAIIFLAGGYIVPAIVMAIDIVKAELAADDDPTFFDIAASAIWGGLLWPFTPSRAEPM